MIRGSVEDGHRLTAAEREREPRSLALVAYFDGYTVGSGQGPRHPMPRRLTRSEAAAWREGWADGRAERTCHAAHGFAPCPGRPHA